ncbi:MAG: hypothetical protein HKO81_02510 [Flavobacteriaceae bacterium]|nr:hypothetical protein [Flavobacteriaceae bacterium]
MKNILKVALLSVLLFACDAEMAKQDPAGITDESLKPRVSYNISTTTASELDETVIVVDITMDRAIGSSTVFTAEQVGGNAVLHEDYEIISGEVPAYGTTGQMSITITKDLDEEGDESLELLIGALAVPDTYEVIGDTNLSLTIEDWVFCSWFLETTDTYGDGWNGGYVELVTEGVTTTYACAGASSDFEIGITDGEDYTFTYVSGGGTGGGPGWESENYYKLTAPDGTEYIDGTQDYSGIPTPGLIVSGTNACP